MLLHKIEKILNVGDDVTDSDQLKAVGLKITTPRLNILKILKQASQHHVSAENIYHALRNQGEDIGLATVYRVLTQFETAGLVIRHFFEGGQSVFELAQDSHHDHLVCIECARIEEFVDNMIENRQHIIAEQAGFKMTSHQLNIYGICPSCQQNN